MTGRPVRRCKRLDVSHLSPATPCRRILPTQPGPAAYLQRLLLRLLPASHTCSPVCVAAGSCRPSFSAAASPSASTRDAAAPSPSAERYPPSPRWQMGHTALVRSHVSTQAAWNSCPAGQPVGQRSSVTRARALVRYRSPCSLHSPRRGPSFPLRPSPWGAARTRAAAHYYYYCGRSPYYSCGRSPH
jgi:hypothetical protein